MNASLRPLEDSDLAIYEQMNDPASVQMAAFTVDDRDFAPGRGEEIGETILRLD